MLPAVINERHTVRITARVDKSLALAGRVPLPT